MNAEQSKYTPGPWEVGENDKNEQGVVMCSDGALVAIICHECVKPQSEVQANARLIAAAPETALDRDRLRIEKAELLETLELVANQSFYGSTTGYFHVTREVMSKVQELITKLAGGANAS